MAQLSVQNTSLDGVAVTYAAASSGGDSFSNDGNTVLRVKNGGTAAVTVTIASPKPCNYGFNHDVAVSVAAGAEEEVGVFAPVRFNDASGNVSVTYSAVTSVTVAAVRN